MGQWSMGQSLKYTTTSHPIAKRSALAVLLIQQARINLCGLCVWNVPIKSSLSDLCEWPCDYLAQITQITQIFLNALRQYFVNAVVKNPLASRASATGFQKSHPAVSTHRLSSTQSPNHPITQSPNTPDPTPSVNTPVRSVVKNH